MSRIRIKNFGPIKEGLLENDGWIDINKVTLFIGNQGSGKSTVAKTISVLTWLEKSINRGDTDKEMSSTAFKSFFRSQRIFNYFNDDTYIEYIGEAFHIKFDKKELHSIISPTKGGRYIVPKIMYVPAERNLLSTIEGVYNINGLPENLLTFAEELRRAQLELDVDVLILPIGNYSYSYNKQSNISTVMGLNYQIDLLEASSGLQSLIPLYLVSKNIASMIASMIKQDSDKYLSWNQRIKMYDEIAKLINSKKDNKEKLKGHQTIIAKYYSKCFINIVEEPEQNLYPSSQREILNSLLGFTNEHEGNQLIMTTHSPYLINYLSLAVKAHSLKNKISNHDYKARLHKIVPVQSTIEAEGLSIYEMDETNETIKKLETYHGLPSDENLLNTKMGEGNDLFDELLDIEQSL